MKTNKKLSLSDLKVESFVTSMSKQKVQTVKGGNPTITIGLGILLAAVTNTIKVGDDIAEDSDNIVCNGLDIAAEAVSYEHACDAGFQSGVNGDPSCGDVSGAEMAVC
jgi:hypothetical protein